MKLLMTFAGIPVLHDPALPHIAAAKGLWRFKRIVVGPIFFKLSRSEQVAILYHEFKHCAGMHLELRILMLPLFWTKLVARIAWQQELDADAFAVQHGYGVELLRVIVRYFGGQGEFYPSSADRVSHLRQRIREYQHAKAAA